MAGAARCITGPIVAAVLADAPRRDDRLFFAIGCSLVLHFSILGLLPGFFQPRPEIPQPKALTARLVAPRPEPAKAIEPSAPEPKQPVVKHHRAAPHKPAPRTAEPVAPPVIAVAPTPTSPPAAVVQAAPPAPTPPTVASAAPAVPASPPGTPTATTPVATAPDQGSIAQFRMELIAMAKRYKRYPRAAVDNNWEGKVDLRMIVAANGTIASLSIRKSAGYGALDDEAQQMFRTAKTQITVPPVLRGKEFTVDVSADFYFKE